MTDPSSQIREGTDGVRVRDQARPGQEVALGLPVETEVNRGRFTEGQQVYLHEHRRRIFPGTETDE